MNEVVAQSSWQRGLGSTPSEAFAGDRQRGAGYRQNVVVQRKVTGAALQIVDALYDGSEIEGREPSSILRWRIPPRQLSVSCKLGSKRSYVQLGKLIYLPAGIPYALRELPAGATARNLLVRFEKDSERLISPTDEWTCEMLDNCCSMACPRVEATMQRLIVELTNPGFACDLLVEALLTSLIVDLGRHFRQRNSFDASDRAGPSRLSDFQLRQIREFVYAARGGCPTTNQLARLCDMAPSSFRQRFKATTGSSVHAFVELLQLERAKQLLLDTDMLMKEIAYELGFTHQATFSSSFRRLAGICPAEFRRMHR